MEANRCPKNSFIQFLSHWLSCVSASNHESGNIIYPGYPIVNTGVGMLAPREAAERLKAEGNAAFQKEKYGAAVDVRIVIAAHSCMDREPRPYHNSSLRMSLLKCSCMCWCSDTQRRFCYVQTGQCCSPTGHFAKSKGANGKTWRGTARQLLT